LPLPENFRGPNKSIWTLWFGIVHWGKRAQKFVASRFSFFVLWHYHTLANFCWCLSMPGNQHDWINCFLFWAVLHDHIRCFHSLNLIFLLSVIFVLLPLSVGLPAWLLFFTDIVLHKTILCITFEQFVLYSTDTFKCPHN
jgi:hypothetical protein